MQPTQDQSGSNGAPRVLVVEDHVDTLALLGKLLARMKIDAIPTQNCATARAAARQWGRFHLVIADYTLPDGNGADLLAEFKAQSACTTIMVSGHPLPPGGLPAGVDEWVPKPVDLGALTRVVKSTMKGQAPTVDRKPA